MPAQVSLTEGVAGASSLGKGGLLRVWTRARFRGRARATQTHTQTHLGGEVEEVLHEHGGDFNLAGGAGHQKLQRAVEEVHRGRLVRHHLQPVIHLADLGKVFGLRERDGHHLRCPTRRLPLDGGLERLCKLPALALRQQRRRRRSRRLGVLHPAPHIHPCQLVAARGGRRGRERQGCALRRAAGQKDKARSGLWWEVRTRS